MSAPSVLVVTSEGSSDAAVMPVLAALEAAGLDVRAIDVGRTSRSSSTFDRMIRAVTGSEPSGSRVTKELTVNPPDVAVAFDPGATTVLTVARNGALQPSPVVAVVDELTPDEAWGVTDADRYLVVDDEAAMSLQEGGVAGDRILTVGPLCESRFWQAATTAKSTLRKRFKLASGPVVLVEVAGLGYDTTTQVALQLSLSQVEPTYLFDAGDDVEAATALRRQVPALGMKAKLFGKTDDAQLFWRCADAIIARPRPRAVARALVLGAPMVAFLPEDRVGERLAKGLEARGSGATATNALLVTSALEPLLAGGTRKDDRVGADGAANVADIAWIVGSEGRAILDGRNRAASEATSARVAAAANAAEATARQAAAAGGLEDLGSGAGAASNVAYDVPNEGELDTLRAEVESRIEKVNRAVVAARESAELWERRRLQAKKKGKPDLAAGAERNADTERARMHAALSEMAQLQSEMSRLERAAEAAAAAPPPRPSQARPSGAASTKGASRTKRRRGTGTSAHSNKNVDDMLEEMKRNASVDDDPPPRKRSSSSGKKSPKKRPKSTGKSRRRKPKKDTVEDELAALKRKMRDGNK